MPTATAPPQLLVQQWERFERLRTQAARLVLNQWVDGATVEELVQSVLAAQAAIVDLTDAALSQAAGLTTSSTPAALGIEADPLIGAHARRGLALEKVYGRAGSVAELSGPDAVREWLESSVRIDMQLAHRAAAAAHVAADRRVVAWRRQIAPAGKTCGLCVAASTRLYHLGDLLPIHHHCRCTVVEVYDTSPIRGPILDRERLDEVYRAAGQRIDRRTLSHIEIDVAQLPAGIDSDAIRALEPRIVDHPEFGPYLDGRNHDTVFAVPSLN